MASSVRKAYEQAVKETVKEMEAEGRRILKECVEERDYQHQTKNLYDSYGYGIYREGRLVKSGFLGAARAKISKKWYGETIQGRSEIQAFLQGEYKPGEGLELVIAAAMPYAEVLETGSGLHRKYKVVSMSYDKLADICPSFGKVKAILV